MCSNSINTTTNSTDYTYLIPHTSVPLIFQNLESVFSCMALNLLSYEVSDLCLGKPPLRSLSVSSTVSDALLALKRSQESYLSVWTCNHSSPPKEDFGECSCIGKICMVDIVCYLCREENLSSPTSALNSPISVLLPKVDGRIRHVNSQLSLLDAINFILEGAQNLVVPIQSNITHNSRRKLHQKSSYGSNLLHGGFEYCWLTQEDVIRFFFNCIGLFSPITAYSVETLNIINTNILAIGYYDPASSLVDAISTSLLEQTSIAVVDHDSKLIGEISPFTLGSCDEIVTAAITTLSAGDLLTYVNHRHPPEDIVEVVKARLRGRNLEGMLNLLEEGSSHYMSSSDEDESCSQLCSPNRSGRFSRCGSYSAKMARSVHAIACHPRSSLVAVMMQAIAHRVNYVWVIEDDYRLVGMVTFSDILKVFRGHLQTISQYK